MNNNQNQPLDTTFQVTSNIVLKIYFSPTPQKYFSFKVESKKKKRLPRNSSSVQFASKQWLPTILLLGEVYSGCDYFAKKTNDLEIEEKRN